MHLCRGVPGRLRAGLREAKKQIKTSGSGPAIAERCAMTHVPSLRSDRDALIAATALVQSPDCCRRAVSRSRS